MALSWTLDKLGPLGRTADDCGLVLEAISGPDPNDATTSNRQFKYSTKPLKRFKLAVPKGITESVDEAMRRNFEDSLPVLQSVATLETIEFPDLPYDAITRTILNAESASAFEDFIQNGKAVDLTAPGDHYGPYARTAVLAKDYLKAMRLRGVMAKATYAVMAPYDAIVAPSRRTVATPIDREFRSVVSGTYSDIVGSIGNAAGLPAVSVPNGFSERGLPTGIQFMGKAYDENTILAVARVYQSLTDWHLHHPPNLRINE
jgi:aspartyl-tRNA(Asn)/glutamyl-tRNA(Gln) amidotransferase subunit A